LRTRRACVTETNSQSMSWAARN